MSSEKNEKLEIRWTNEDDAPQRREDLLSSYAGPWDDGFADFMRLTGKSLDELCGPDAQKRARRLMGYPKPPNPRHSIDYPGSELAHYENY